MTTLSPITGSQVRDDFLPLFRTSSQTNPDLNALWNEANEVASHVGYHLELGDTDGAQRLTDQYHAILEHAHRVAVGGPVPVDYED